MKTFSFLIFAIVFFCPFIIASVYIEDALSQELKPSPDEILEKANEENKQKYYNLSHDVTNMLGYIGTAGLALRQNMTGEAASNLNKALSHAQDIWRQTTEFNSEIIKVARFSFPSIDDKKQDYWLPVTDDGLDVNGIDSKYFQSKDLKSAAEDAQVVDVKLMLDTKYLLDTLEKAESDMSTKNYMQAQTILMEATQNIFSNALISDKPIMAARDNLVMAGNLAKLGDYDGVGFVLTHVKTALQEYDKTATDEQKQNTQKLEFGISDLQTEIIRYKTNATEALPIGPDISETIEDQIGGWVHDVEALGAAI